MTKTIEKVLILMKRNKINQSQVAEKYGCTREHINRIINGSISTSADVQKKLLAAINEIIKERK